LVASAQIYLQSRYYMDAEGLVPHDPRILAHLEATAAEGLPRSKITLANILIRGAGVEADVPRAVALLEEAGAQGFYDAYWDLRALASAAGDDKWAERWCEKGAALGDHRGFYCIGMFASARGEHEKAFRSLEQARELDPDAAEVRIQLALWLVAGKGTPRNPEQGFAMMKKTADEAEGRARAEAQAHVGIMYSVGVGVEESKELSLAYMEQAAAAGHEGAVDWLKRAANEVEAQPAGP
jgi:TPR repeat protein